MEKRNITQKKLERIYGTVQRKKGSLRCAVGFDAFIDHLFRPIRQRRNSGPEYFKDLDEFAQLLQSKASLSGSIELAPLSTKYGGNNPLLSYGIGKMGISVSSVGAYGGSCIHPIFSPVGKVCELHSFTEPGECYAYEFPKNKLMTFKNMDADAFAFPQFEEKVGAGQLRRLVDECSMFALVNYSEQPAVLSVWLGLLRNYIRYSSPGKLFFFDLADCTHLPDSSLHDCFEAIEGFRHFGRTYLSLNENEFNKLCSLYIPEVLRGETPPSTPRLLHLLWERLPLSGLILRTLPCFYGVDGAGDVSVENIIVEQPRLLTGAGDNQNAGIAVGLMCGLPLADCLLLGVRSGNYYIVHGQGGTLQEICGV